MIIVHTIETHGSLELQLSSIFEHMRYSGSSVREWERTDHKLTVTLVFHGTKTRWEQAYERATKSFLLKISDIRMRSEDTSYKPSGKTLRQCLECRKSWPEHEHLRKNGTAAVRCPYCRSNQTLQTEYIYTRVRAREDLLMLTDDQYPSKYCPITNNDEVQGILIAQVGRAKLIIGRGFERPKDGHKLMLSTRAGHQMDSNRNERQSMIGAVAWCPKNSRVFIGGLGLGVVLLYLAKSHNAREVVVCEIDKDVIDLIEPRLRRWFNEHYPDFNWTVVQGDAFEIVKHGAPYDWVFMDTWKAASDIEEMQRAEAAAKFNLTERGRVTCWMMSTYEKKQKRLQHVKTTNITQKVLQQ